MIRLGGLISQKAFGKFEMGKVISNPFATAFIKEAEGEDHEVSMANNSIDTIIKMATELKAKMGEDEKQIPAWIQDHIAKAENLISQASGNYHEYGDSNESVINEDTRRVKLLGIDFKVSEMNGRIFFSFVDKKAASVSLRQVGTNKIVNHIQNRLDIAYGKGTFFFKSGDHAEFQNGYLFQRNTSDINLNKLKFESIREAGTPIDFKWAKGNTSNEIEKLEAEYKKLIEKGSDILEKQKQLIRKEPLTGEYPWENYDKWPTKLKIEVEKLNLEFEKINAKTDEMGKKLFKLKGFSK